MLKPHQPFLITIVDRDKKLFTVEGPTFDDTPWYEAQAQASAAGRKVDVIPHQSWDTIDCKEPPTQSTPVDQTKRDPGFRDFRCVSPGAILNPQSGGVALTDFETW